MRGRGGITSFCPNRRWTSLRLKKKKRTFYSVTIKVIELVLIKQDTWSRGERVNAPAGCSLTSCIHMHYSAHSTAVQSLNRLVYTSKTGKKKKSAIKKYSNWTRLCPLLVLVQWRFSPDHEMLFRWAGTLWSWNLRLLLSQWPRVAVLLFGRSELMALTKRLPVAF